MSLEDKTEENTSDSLMEKEINQYETNEKQKTKNLFIYSSAV